MSPREPTRPEDAPSDANTVSITTNLSSLVAGGPVLAVDLDDVLCQTNSAISKWHNDNYGTPDEINLSNFYYYYYWKNPFWGSPSVTHGKVREFYQTGWIEHVPLVSGAKEGVEALRRMGYRLIIVTARNKEVEHASWKWVNRHFGDLFECIICTGQFANAQKAVSDGTYKHFVANNGHAVATRLSKAQVCMDIGAKLLIDDSVENAMACMRHTAESGGGVAPPHVLLFGSYEWNKRLSQHSEEQDDMVYAKRIEVEGDNRFLERDVIHCEEELRKVNSPKVRVKRVQDWNEVVAHVEAERAAGRL
ncbi:hypothetical protein F5J12DRAFT_834830 [Pisolithus orientalis]|uniref:uncharacterized protein n=1 Tax=Pisolithus orientalis TaxID=936130 RepID=UPI0022248AD3|nr:uncharacterized protein F5J12DRAFT_834830 [Pisolithus orientalis]KAI6005117.1 hypothetical protein F5J12DRAFT_834830 [Pisolithus orientalis]